MYRVILIPLENSPTDQIILEHIKPLARLAESRVVLIHVADGFAARHQEQLNLEDSDEIVADRAYLERCCADLAAEGLQVTWRLECGDPAEQILAAAEAEGCDLLAMSTHGHRFVKDVLLGSVANTIRHRTSIPVLMVRVPIG